MSTDLLELIDQVSKEIYLPMIESVFGGAGIDAAFRVMKTAKALYKHVEVERVTGQVIVFQLVRRSDQELDPTSGPTDFASLASVSIDDLVIEIVSDGSAHVRTLKGQTAEDLAKVAVVYRYSAGREEFLAGSERKQVLRLDSSAHSQFSVPTLSSLREALHIYARENVRESTCYLFRGAWYDVNRLFLKASPEVTMRNSLTQFLRNRLGADHDVFPEQNVDESHPVDIRVNPRFTNNRLMLIEIKWLGCSVADDGHITANHGNHRAQEGANQLANYLVGQLQSAPSRIIQGYYVIIDCRRKHLSEGATTVSRENGMHFETEELAFEPPHHEIRPDFDPPYRMFARPRCSD